MCPLGDEDEETKSLHAHSSNFFSNVFYQQWDGSADTHGQGLTMLMVFECTSQNQMYTDSHSVLLFLLE